MPIIDLTGRQFGRLRVMSRSTENRNGAHWNCLCQCGNTKVAYGASLRSGFTRSCGCLKAEGNNLRHGMTQSREHHAWSGAIQRCENPKHNRYRYYGGRGISMCPAWRHSFERFLADMGPCPPNHSLERIDRDGDYAPHNCKWTTAVEQANNKSNSRFITVHGKRMTMAETARAYGIKYNVLQRRLGLGWEPEDAVR